MALKLYYFQKKFLLMWEISWIQALPSLIMFLVIGIQETDCLSNLFCLSYIVSAVFNCLWKHSTWLFPYEWYTTVFMCLTLKSWMNSLNNVNWNWVSLSICIREWTLKFDIQSDRITLTIVSVHTFFNHIAFGYSVK